MNIKLDGRRDYELYVKKEVAKMTIPNKQKAIVRKLVLQGFDDGVKMTQGKLEVEVKDEILS